MNKKIIVFVIIIVVVLAGVVSLLRSSSNSVTNNTPTPIVQNQINSQPVLASSSASTGQPFSQYKYFSKSHEIFPTLASDTKKALAAFSYTKTDLGNNSYRFTLTNSAEGFQGQSVVVSNGQSLYFIERSTGDDSASEDSSTKDDMFVVVDAQGNILK